MSFKRVIERPSKSFFLLGPRGTGKSTWLKTLNFNLTIDLLNTRERLAYLQDPGVLRARTSGLIEGDWVLIDEVQKVPELLDEVHSIYESKKINFALSGSSARKLKRSGVNLLAGRAINRKMFPLIQSEYGKNTFEINNLIDWGTLPLIIDNWQQRQDTLSTYVDNYLRQELIEEGIIRKIEPFARFLSAAGKLNGQVLNVENVARDAKVKRPTVDKYFEVLYDTLIGFKLPAYQPNIRMNESAQSRIFV
ncbi:MAG: AAA family ATPase [Proteobacteria bacterium]|nr:AAA family ATPase [Pseudomonadota bacterium]